MHLGTAASCCKAYSVPLTKYNTLHDLREFWRQEHQQMSEGHAVESCTVCWQQESQDKISYRQLQPGAGIDQIELFIDNACNQMCSYCSPKFSSEWQTNIAQHGAFSGVSRKTNLNHQIVTSFIDPEFWIYQVQQYIRSQPANSVVVKLLGGEPLMQFRHLQKLLEFNSERVAQLRINTNLNPPSNKFLKWLLDSVPREKLWFDISLDASLEFNHVPRAGFCAKRFSENLALIQLHQVGYSLMSVVSILNIFDIQNLIGWANQHQHNLEFFPLNNPDCLDVKLLPQQFVEKIDTSNFPKFAIEALSSCKQNIDIKLLEQYNYLKQYFQRTDTDPDNTANPAFGEYWYWLTERFR